MYKTGNISETIEDRAKVAVNGLYKVVHWLSIAAKMYERMTLDHRRRLHGGDGGDRLHGQKVVGAMPSNRPHRNFVMSFFEIVKCTLKIPIHDYASDKRCADLSLKMHQKCLAAGLRQDPLGELTALPQTS